MLKAFYIVLNILIRFKEKKEKKRKEDKMFCFLQSLSIVRDFDFFEFFTSSFSMLCKYSSVFCKVQDIMSLFMLSNVDLK